MPGDEAGRVVVWVAGDALLAIAVDAVIEVATVEPDGRVRTRHGALDPVALPGVIPDAPARAVVIRAGDRLVALPAERVEGVMEHRGPVEDTPGWLRRLEADHVHGLVRLHDGRIAAVLDPGAIRAPS